MTLAIQIQWGLASEQWSNCRTSAASYCYKKGTVKASTINRVIVGSSLFLALGLLSINYQQDRIIQNQRVVLRMLLNDSASLAQCKVARERVATRANAPGRVLMNVGSAGLPALPSPPVPARPGS